MTDDERQMVAALRGVTFPIGTWQKRFARGLMQMRPDEALSEAQKAWLVWLVYRYRRQIAPATVALSYTVDLQWGRVVVPSERPAVKAPRP